MNISKLTQIIGSTIVLLLSFNVFSADGHGHHDHDHRKKEAADTHKGHGHGHGHAHGRAMSHDGDTYYGLHATIGIGITEDDEDFLDSHYHGFWGNDTHKLFIMGKIHRHDNVLEDAETWFLYSRAVSEFWDVQVGWRHDSQPEPLEHLAFGINGLAPFFIKTQLHAAISEDDNDANIRLHQSRKFFLTDKVTLTPYLEINYYTDDVPEREIQSGFGDSEFGVRLGYNIHKNIAPYFDLRYEVDFADEESEAEDDGHGHGGGGEEEDEHGHGEDFFVFMLGVEIHF